MKHVNLIRRSVLLMLFFTCVLAVLLPAINLFAQCTECTTYVSGVISGQTWTKANSPYCVEDDITVTSLTIEAGVEVCFLGNYLFDVTGVITAIGTEAEHIVFMRHVGNTEGWQGVSFSYSSASSKLIYCDIDGSINSGIRIIECLPTIDKCTIGLKEGVGNEAYNGGGMYIELTSGDELVITDCLIENNYCNRTKAIGEHRGGGIYAKVGENARLLFSRCKIIGNTNNSRCESSGCDVYGRGGGIYKEGQGRLFLENCFVESNLVYAEETYWGTWYPDTAYSDGGGIYINSGELLVTNSVIKDNKAEAIDNGSISTPYARGGGIYLNSGTSNLTNCTVRNNLVKVPSGSSSYAEGGGLYRKGGTMTTINSIIFYNQKQIGVDTPANSQIYGDPTVTYSDVQGGYPGEGNINQSPSFIDDYHIDGYVSPCIDKGNNAGIPGIGLPPTDIDGNPRICNGIVDMGADEYYECVEDRDSDGICDTQDNCPSIPNGPIRGVCTSGAVEVNGVKCNKIGRICTSNVDCGVGGYCSMAQENTYGDSKGDACDSKMECKGNFDCDSDVDGTDAFLFKINFFRINCPACSNTCLEQQPQ